MRAVIRRNKQLVCDEIADLKPAEGQLLVKTLACGICGSDLHALHHMEHMIDLSRRAGAPWRSAVPLLTSHAARAPMLGWPPHDLRPRPGRGARP